MDEEKDWFSNDANFLDCDVPAYGFTESDISGMDGKIWNYF